MKKWTLTKRDKVALVALTVQVQQQQEILTKLLAERDAVWLELVEAYKLPTGSRPEMFTLKGETLELEVHLGRETGESREG